MCLGVKTKQKKIQLSVLHFFDGLMKIFIPQSQVIWVHIIEVICANTMERRGGGGWSRGAHFWSKFFSTYNRSRRKGASRQEKVTKNDITRRARSQKRDVPRTNFSMYFFVLLNIFLLHSHEALIILQRATRKHIQEPMTSIFPSTIIKWNKIDIKIQKLFRS